MSPPPEKNRACFGGQRAPKEGLGWGRAHSALQWQDRASQRHLSELLALTAHT